MILLCILQPKWIAPFFFGFIQNTYVRNMKDFDVIDEIFDDPNEKGPIMLIVYKVWGLDISFQNLEWSHTRATKKKGYRPV